MSKEFLLLIIIFAIGIGLAILIYPDQQERIKRMESLPKEGIRCEFLANG